MDQDHLLAPQAKEKDMAVQQQHLQDLLAATGKDTVVQQHLQTLHLQLSLPLSPMTYVEFVKIIVAHSLYQAVMETCSEHVIGLPVVSLQTQMIMVMLLFDADSSQKQQGIVL